MTKPLKVDPELIQQLLEELRNKRSREEICAKFHVSDQYLTKLAYVHGIENVKRSAAESLRSYGLRVGVTTFSAFLQTLPDDVINWLWETSPRGVQMTTKIRKLVIEEYKKETGKDPK